MIEKPVPWWRRALNYALSGLRSGFGLFSKPPRPASPETSSLEEDRFLNNPEPTQEPEHILEVEEALTDHPANPATVVSVAEHEIEPVPAIEPVTVTATESPAASDQVPASTSEIAPLVDVVPTGEIVPTEEIAPANEVLPADGITPSDEIVSANEVAAAEEIVPSEEMIPADEIALSDVTVSANETSPSGVIDSQSASQPAEGSVPPATAS